MLYLVLAAGALAANSAPQPPAVVSAEKPKSERRICRQMQETGTRIGIREICKTAAQWQLEKDQAERMMDGRRDMHDVVPRKAGEPLSPSVPPL